MNITTLGSGAWEGIPAPFCSCRVCVLGKQEPVSKNNRTRPQFLFENDKKSFLLEVSPDIRLQSTRFDLPVITDFVVSHWHFDHMSGLFELHAWLKKIPEHATVHCSQKTADMIHRNLSHLPLDINILKPFKSYTLHGIVLTPLPVRHMFLEDEKIPDEALENTFAFIFEQGGKRVAYLADYYHIPRPSLEKLTNLDIAIADGTYILMNDLKNIKLNHLHGEDVLRLTESIGSKKTYFHSISHLTQKTHDEVQRALPPDHFATYDGERLL